MPDRSPFPGMDPWLEASWGDVHHTIISSLRRQVFRQLPPGLFARIEETVVFIDAGWERHVYRPDVGVFGTGGRTAAGHDDGGGRRGRAGPTDRARPNP